LDALYGTGETLAAEAGTEPALATINARFATLIAELRITRTTLLAAQHQTDAKIDAQDVRLSTVEELVGGRLTTILGQLDEAQQRLLDAVKITAAQQAVIRRAIERLGKRYEKKTGKAIYDLLHARFCAELGMPRYDALPAKSMGRPWTGYARVQRSICQMIRTRSRRCRRVCFDGRSTEHYRYRDRSRDPRCAVLAWPHSGGSRGTDRGDTSGDCQL
jgi:hypothetical protein